MIENRLLVIFFLHIQSVWIFFVLSLHLAIQWSIITLLIEFLPIRSLFFWLLAFLIYILSTFIDPKVSDLDILLLNNLTLRSIFRWRLRRLTQFLISNILIILVLGISHIALLLRYHMIPILFNDKTVLSNRMFLNQILSLLFSWKGGIL